MADRIRRVYNREADVVYPAVDTDFFTPAPNGSCSFTSDHQLSPLLAAGGFFITVCTAVPYKRLDIAVEAFNELGLPLLVVGRGPGLPALRKMARPNIRFLPWVGGA